MEWNGMETLDRRSSSVFFVSAYYLSLRCYVMLCCTLLCLLFLLASCVVGLRMYVAALGWVYVVWW